MKRLAILFALLAGAAFGQAQKPIINQNTNGDMPFIVGTSTLMTLQGTTGRLGIGVTAPEGSLHVKSGDAVSRVVIDRAGDGTAALLLGNNVSAGGTDKYWKIGVTNSGPTVLRISTVSDSAGVTGSADVFTLARTTGGALTNTVGETLKLLKTGGASLLIGADAVGATNAYTIDNNGGSLRMYNAGGQANFSIEQSGQVVSLPFGGVRSSKFNAQQVTGSGTTVYNTGSLFSGASLNNGQFFDVTWSSAGPMLIAVTDGGANTSLILCYYSAATCTELNDQGITSVTDTGTANRILKAGNAVVRFKNCTGGSGTISLQSLTGEIASVGAVTIGNCP